MSSLRSRLAIPFDRRGTHPGGGPGGSGGRDAPGDLFGSAGLSLKVQVPGGRSLSISPPLSSGFGRLLNEQELAPELPTPLGLSLLSSPPLLRLGDPGEASPFKVCVGNLLRSISDGSSFTATFFLLGLGVRDLLAF